MNLKNFIIRVCTAIVYVVLLVGCTLYNPFTAGAFFALVAGASIFEFGTIANRHAGASLPRFVNAVAGTVLVAATWLAFIEGNGADKLYMAYVMLLMYLLIGELYRGGKNPLLNWVVALASQLYIALPFALLALLIIVTPSEEGTYVVMGTFPLALFVFLWCNDTGAYLVGCSLSRYFPAKLFPSISPKKSWVGSIGGALLTMGVSVLVWHFTPGAMPLWRWLGFALTVVVFGTWGDLVESQLKRQLGIKDSGRVLPGHGGMLDRFDSALLAIPAVVVYFFLTQSI